MNEVLIEGWLGADPKDYPETDDKPHFVRLDIALEPRGARRPGQWVSVCAYGDAADRIMEELLLAKGTRVRVSGFLSTRYANPGCGRIHRFTVVVAREVEQLTRPPFDEEDQQAERLARSFVRDLFDDESLQGCHGPPVGREDNPGADEAT